MSSQTIEQFYDNRKKLFDLSGNCINQDNYPFIGVLSNYLNDIVNSIDIEIKNSTRRSIINWREKKNPKLLSRLINNDDNVNLINRSMNKITAGNYMNIVNEITTCLEVENPRKLPEYCKFLFDSTIKKCIADEIFIKDYITFLLGFNTNISSNLNIFINQFISEVVTLLTTNNDIKQYTYFHFIKDTINFKNIGIIFSQLALCYNTNTSDLIQKYNLNINLTTIQDSLYSNFLTLNNCMDWLPINIDELNTRFYITIGIMETIIIDIWNIYSNEQQTFIKNFLDLSYNSTHIPNKIKFKILDLQDIIKNIKSNTSKTSIISTPAVSISNPIVPDKTVIPVTPVIPTTPVTPVKPVISNQQNQYRNQDQNVNKYNQSSRNKNEPVIIRRNNTTENNTQNNTKHYVPPHNKNESKHESKHYESKYDSKHESKNYESKNKKDEVVVIRRNNRFEGLELDDEAHTITNNVHLSNTKQSSINKSHVISHSTVDTNINNDDDDFIKIERKSSKNDIYKPKKNRK